MNHQNYLDMIYEDAQDLSDMETLALSEHLEVCEQCRSLVASFRALETMMIESGLVIPSAGFTARWEDRLEAERTRIHRRQIFSTLAFVGTSLLLLSAIALYLIWPFMRNPSMLLLTWVYQLFTFYSYLDVIQDIVSSLLNSSRGPISLFTWLFGLGLLSELAVLWVVSYRFLTNPRRATQ